MAELSGDEKSNYIIQLLGETPKGLGFNEMRDLLVNYMAPGTLKLRLDGLVKNGHVRFEPENWRQGQQKVFILTEAYEKYLELLDKIENGTREYISELKKYEKSPELPDNNFRYLVLTIRQFYSIPNIIASIGSWNYGWTRDPDAVVEILTFLYVSFQEVNEVLNKVLNEQIQRMRELKHLTREVTADMEKKDPDTVEDFDKIDLKLLNFWEKPEIILDFFEKGTRINHENKKRT